MDSVAVSRTASRSAASAMAIVSSRTLNGATVTTGEREIVPEDARVVERIFREFVAGVSPKQIAKNLNREDVAGHSAVPGV